MGMRMIMRRISESQLHEAVANPSRAQDLAVGGVMPMPPEVWAQMQARLPTMSVEQRARVEKMRRDSEDPKVLALEKEWQLLHYLLSGEYKLDASPPTANPSTMIILGGNRTVFEVGYGPAFFLSAPEVVIAEQALSHHSDDELRHRADLKKLNTLDLYGAPSTGWVEEELKFTWAILARLRKFFAEAVAEQDCIFKAIT